MVHGVQAWLVPITVIMVIMGSNIGSTEAQSKKLKSQSFLSPVLPLTPGLAMNKFFYNIDFPRDHIAMKQFNAELVDEEGNSIPLYDTYLHHWTVVRYYQHIDTPDPDNTIPYLDVLSRPGFIVAGNMGTCQPFILSQFYGIGSESRRTSTFIPDPYGLELGDPQKTPANYRERWILNVHAIDTRGVPDKLKCAECWRDSYNTTVDEYGKPLDPGYKGGMKCCYDSTQCILREDYNGSLEAKNVYMKYTVTYLDWDASIIPVKNYLLDVTDTWTLSNPIANHHCSVEYSVEACYPTSQNEGSCFATRRVKLIIPSGGYFLYGSIHQHNGGINGRVYGEDGRVLCTSTPFYGTGLEAGNEKGYLVGISSCYPKPGSIRIRDGEVLTVESNYAPGETHLGVMGVFNIMLSERLPSKPCLNVIETTSELLL